MTLNSRVHMDFVGFTDHQTYPNISPTISFGLWAFRSGVCYSESAVQGTKSLAWLLYSIPNQMGPAKAEPVTRNWELARIQIQAALP